MQRFPLSLIVIVTLGLLAVAALPLYSFTYLYPAVTDLIIKGRERDARQLVDHLAHMYAAAIGEAGIGPHLQDTDFPETVQRLAASFGLVKVKAFSPAGEVIYSTDPQDIGKINTKPYFTQVVARGGKYTKVVQKNEKTLEDQIILRDVVETYTPVMQGERFLGAFELYYDITESKAALRRLLSTAQWLAFFIALTLLTGMIVATLQARRFLRLRDKAEEQLRQANRDLSLLLDFASRINKTLRLEELLPQAFNTLLDLKILPIDRQGCIFLVEGDRLRLVFHTQHDEGFLAAHQNLKKGECLCGQAAVTGEAIVSPSCFADKQHTIRPKDGHDHGHIVLPLKAMDEVVGVLCLYTAPRFQLAAAKQRLLEALAAQLGIMIKNAQLYESTKRLSLHDPLTGLANRRFMETRLEQELRAARRYRQSFAVLLFDIDHFKRYNDTHGHDAGDRLLAKVAQVASSTIRESDFAARYGGEEFLIILGSESAVNTCRAAERLRQAVAAATEVTISIGGVIYRPEMESEELIRCADQALYHAKEQGRNQAFVWNAPGSFIACTDTEPASGTERSRCDRSADQER